MASSGGAGITPTLHRPPTTPHSFLPLASFSLSGFLSSLLLFVCLGSLACMCVVCLCVSSSGCSVCGGALFSGLFSLCLVYWFFVFLLPFRVCVPGFLVVCLVCCVLCLWCLLFAVCPCCCVRFISVSAVYGVCVFAVLLWLFCVWWWFAYCLLSVIYCVLSLL